MLVGPALLLAAWGAAGASVAWASDDEAVYVRQIMQGGIGTATTDLWAVGNKAMGDEGGIDPALMDDASWAKLEKSAELLESEARGMAQAEIIRAAVAEEADYEEPGTYSMADVQSYIDADPQAFRDLAGALGDHAAALAEAARNKDTATAGTLVDGLDSACEACHAKYWYPNG
jgi:cytochrome c556